MTTFAAALSQPMLAVNNAIMMICVSLLGTPTLVILGYSTNLGNVFYATTMFGLSLKYLGYGRRKAHRAITHILFAMVIVSGSMFLMDEALVLSPMFETRIRILGASFVSFWLVQSFFITLLDRLAQRSSVWRVAIITIVMQALDSAVFFPCAFGGDLPSDTMLQFAVVGWLSKAAIAVCSIPFLMCFQQVRHSDVFLERTSSD